MVRGLVRWNQELAVLQPVKDGNLEVWFRAQANCAGVRSGSDDWANRISTIHIAVATPSVRCQDVER